VHLFALTHRQDTLAGGKKYSLLVKIQSDSSSFDIAKSQYDNQIALSPTSVKEKGLNLEITL
jgi:hypothetical protein